MKKQINRISSKIALAFIITGLIMALPLPGLNTRSSVSAQIADRPADAPPALQGEAAVQRLKEQGLYDSLQEAVTATRYEVRWENAPARGALPPAYHAANPAQQYDSYFTPNGLSLVPRKALSPVAKSDEAVQPVETPEWQATMRLIGYGYGESLLPAGFAALEVRGNRVEYRRAWLPITEWYINKAAGLEQGFTIESPPGVRSEGQQLRLALELTGDLSAELAEGGQAVALKQANGDLALNYGSLYAYDARRRELPSRMRVSEGRVILEVDDEKAVYPVTIDPVFSQQALLVHNGGAAYDYSGESVAIYGDTAVVGVPGASSDGAAYVFVRSGTTWSQQAKLTPSNASSYVKSGSAFGRSVAISGNTVVVGTPYDTSGIYNGSAFVFVRNGTTWSQQQKLSPSDGQASGSFGYAVAISGNTVVVGAPDATIGANSYQGSAVIFVRNGTFWGQQQKLIASDGAASDNFGWSVAISGNTVVVGAPQDDIGSYISQGSAYVFARNGTFWSQQQKLIASDGAPVDWFGYSVAINSTGNRIVVGVPGDDIFSASCLCNHVAQGSAYLFARNFSTWSQQQKLTASDGGIDDQFGRSVAISGYEVVVGAPNDDIGAAYDQGSAYVFASGGGTTWSLQQKLIASDGLTDHRFGNSVAASVGTFVVGAPGWDYWGFLGNQGVAYGAAYVFISQ